MFSFSEAHAKDSQSQESASDWMIRASTWPSTPLELCASLLRFSSWSGGPPCPTAVEVGSADEATLLREFVESNDFAAFPSGVQDIGYLGAWSILDAQYFGVAQPRERVFFVGHARDWRYPAAVLLEPESLCGNTMTRPRRAT
jgi:DNA (cytosine-5)-methyltransferase 1